jgi:hypothetical protein
MDQEGTTAVAPSIEAGRMSEVENMKTAIFKVSRGTACARLLAIQVGSLGDAVALESALRSQVGTDCDVEFLGRFDELLMAPTIAEFFALIREPKPQGEHTTEEPIVLWPRSVLVTPN